MQELREYVIKERNEAHIHLIEEYKNAMNHCLNAIDKLLSKEKEQIQLAYHDGFMKSEISYISHTYPIPQVIQCTEEYYQNTYQNKSITQ